MRLVSWNVNGIRSVHKKGALEPLLKKYDPDILCFQETKAERHQSEVDLPQYEEYWNSSKAKKGYSGTAIFTKEKPVAVLFDFPEHILDEYEIEGDQYGNPNDEGRVITAEFPDFFVVNVYTPNAKDDLSRIPLRHEKWDPAFRAFVAELQEVKPVLACGDFNVAHTSEDLARPKENEGKKGFTHEEREGMDALLNAGFLDTFRMFTQGNGHYTWWTAWGGARERNVGWRIDYVFASQQISKKIRSAQILSEIMGSDHCPVLLDLK